MTRFVPFDTTYDQIRKLEKSSFILLLVSAFLIMINWVLPKFFDNEINSKYDDVKEIAKVISYVSMVCYLIINLISRILFHNVEKRKRNDLIDNSFGTNYSDENTVGYYNNEETQNGIKKLTLNSYESSFHTENTLKLMLYKNLIILIVLSVPFLLSIFSKNGSDIVRLLFEISIPLTLISEFIVMLIYYLNVSEINERFKIELTNLGNKSINENDIPKLLIPIMEYYSIKAWANTNLDSAIFNKNNTKISEKWKARKIKLIQ
ncbi:hypothetical protein [Flavobacterium sp. A45]|uniref:hypothetical protein n=1 Tax=Flavobacterium sp. A45 TaxID=1945862 RepID=UPI000986AE6E|nr:hypothetical protein [Flavobacterium sp. A45]OOG69966.1 hypothetical protein B0E44_11550 [Flavobacterium sp. A45]